MLTLKKQSGLQLAFDDDAITLGKGVVSEPVHARTLEDARPYLMDKHATARRKNLYLMYRDMHREQDESIFRKYHIRYDITVLFPGTLGGKKGEYIRTIGHTHPAAEIYEVLAGEAMFVVQQIGAKQNDVFYIAATKNEKVLIPSGYGHITINVGTEPLILADLFSDSIKSNYSFFKKRRGAAFWVLLSPWEAEGITLAENKAHKDAGEVALGTPADLSKLGFPKKTPLYTLFTEDPTRFDILTNPKKEVIATKKTPLFTVNWKGKLA
ncbi:hypothetical protein A2524_03960 [Candidatus Wolfebacteria bacterium RIFOXYD12_FULL_48_21]|uniref:glucose-6-phosphate isomerase n=1 Tax=Candidatus Wolfebacteria bacterium RIFOXYD1_FULL_48_65 TaxID=1802561 RepID=A0A1F8E392_9BACT|nr:MAG: hypothetical protein A2524_03960 [Candidatus Wolfebacteria bacterium RIFOXYD12_FULL_48_21]OGM95333.1 MAG: hypothetical protein A2610_02480 [Candidatus Wolfebacteria bacterium RIFOXYD1_FULL_48_65]OGM95915.1 MAG: hypothetical protein A2532_02515 [Candidatus Wolfebacteria bacterium RIFOXYD2_FULL_48_11]